jgi:DNA-binding beta-propeller fold protein YncE
VDPKTGHVFVTVQKGVEGGKSNSIFMLSDRTNKIIARVPIPKLPAFSSIGPLGASPATGVIYVEVNPLRQGSQIWIIGTRGAKVLAKINADFGGDDVAVDDQNHLLSELAQDTVTLINGRTHKVGPAVDVTNGTPEAGAQAEAITPLTHTVYAAVECDPNSWVTAVDEQTNKVVATISVSENNSALRSMAADPRRSVVFAVDFLLNDVMIINSRTNTVITTLGTGNRPGAIAVNPATGRAYVANTNHTLTVIEPAGNSARQAGGPAGATGRATAGQAVGQRRGFCG